MSEVRVCDRCNYKAYADGPSPAPKFVPAADSVLCDGCKAEVVEEVRRR